MSVFDRITVNPDICGGMPTIRGMRIPVLTICKMIAGQAKVKDVLEQYPELTVDDVAQAVLYGCERSAGELWGYVVAEEERLDRHS